MQTTFAAYRAITSHLDRSLELKSEERPVALETAYYLDNIGKVKSIDDFLKNTRLFKFAMNAFGLSDMAHAKAFVRKILTEGVADKKSFANRLDDDRFLAFARTFDFAAKGEATTDATAARQGVVDRYVRQSLEVAAGEDNEGVRLALYFQREAPNVSSVYGLLADAALWQVVKTTFGFPDGMTSQDIDKQGAAVAQRLDIADLKDPVKLDRLIARFTAAYDASTGAKQDPVLTLFNRTSSATVDINLVMAMKTLKHGGR